jgi:hypothetical protein
LTFTHEELLFAMRSWLKQLSIGSARERSRGPVARQGGRAERRVRTPLGTPCALSQYLIEDRTRGAYGLISSTPPIFYVKYWIDEGRRLQYCLDPLFNGVGNRTAYFLYSWRWWIEDPERIAFERDVEVEHRRRYPKHHFIHLCNTLPQLDVFQAAGLEAFFCPQNALVDERLFLPLSTVPKRFDAVYDARLKGYKRHSLARDIESLALIYAFDTDIDDCDCAEQIRRQLPHAHFFNHTDPDTYRALSPEEVNVCLNSSRVGLCLSAVEGTMYASIQYLLCGLPVVSTPSKGGATSFSTKCALGLSILIRER